MTVFKEDYLSATTLHKAIKEEYSYFDYETNEALYLSPSEEETIWSLVRTMHKEAHNNTDGYSKSILLAHLWFPRFCTVFCILRKMGVFLVFLRSLVEPLNIAFF